MTKVAELAEEYQHHPRWENEWSVVQIWLITHEGDQNITDKDQQMAEAIDAYTSEEGPQGELAADPSAHPDKVKIFGDGGSRGNPGPSASGFVILDMEDNVWSTKVFTSALPPIIKPNTLRSSLALKSA